MEHQYLVVKGIGYHCIVRADKFDGDPKDIIATCSDAAKANDVATALAEYCKE